MLRRETAIRRDYRLVIAYLLQKRICVTVCHALKLSSFTWRAVHYRRSDTWFYYLISAHRVCENTAGEVSQVLRVTYRYFITMICAVRNGFRNISLRITHLASLLRILGDLLTAICDGDRSISLALSVLAFSKTWKRDLTFRLESSSSPRSGLSEAEIQKEIFLLLSSALLAVQTFQHPFSFSPDGKLVSHHSKTTIRGKSEVAHTTRKFWKATKITRRVSLKAGGRNPRIREGERAETDRPDMITYSGQARATAFGFEHRSCYGSYKLSIFFP